MAGYAPRRQGFGG